MNGWVIKNGIFWNGINLKMSEYYKGIKILQLNS